MPKARGKQRGKGNRCRHKGKYQKKRNWGSNRRGEIGELPEEAKLGKYQKKRNWGSTRRGEIGEVPEEAKLRK
ncbi:hypothetical protein POVWA2_056030 [Plasmodium ovale wallikeri]|uniref:Uncharacterized protein n=2 Tax=Plasmodium ovale TaxID=36330 RepID=A0A1A8ZX02_PLAOA|nr:hypothetical protein POVWA1_056650 [Plasmodium ovale wallikeri]SBT48415.1 hypothetical protein POVWA2_056030 [Plasmodium ovale wallikeri]SBT82400.1 hypothetical protein POWCR01_140026500 [Plasmodium ovale]